MKKRSSKKNLEVHKYHIHNKHNRRVEAIKMALFEVIPFIGMRLLNKFPIDLREEDDVVSFKIKVKVIS